MQSTEGELPRLCRGDSLFISDYGAMRIFSRIGEGGYRTDEDKGMLTVINAGETKVRTEPYGSVFVIG